jgi:hypothetical protein
LQLTQAFARLASVFCLLEAQQAGRSGQAARHGARCARSRTILKESKVIVVALAASVVQVLTLAARCVVEEAADLGFAGAGVGG